MEALAAERAKRQQDVANASTREEIGRAVLGALAQKLNAEPIPGWLFVFEDQFIRIFRNQRGARQQAATWTLDQHMRLQSGEHMTEWVTSESYQRVIDQAVKLTAAIIVDAETGDDRTSAGIVELPPRF
jgi:hypothetical protein